MRLLLDAKADVDKARTGNGATPLSAADKGHTDIVRLLMDASADVAKARTDNGATPLSAAADKGHTETSCAC